MSFEALYALCQSTHDYNDWDFPFWNSARPKSLLSLPNSTGAPAAGGSTVKLNGPCMREQVFFPPCHLSNRTLVLNVIRFLDWRGHPVTFKLFLLCP